MGITKPEEVQQYIVSEIKSNIDESLNKLKEDKTLNLDADRVKNIYEIQCFEN